MPRPQNNEAQITLSPEAQRVLQRLRELPENMGQAIAGALDRENELTVGHIQSRYLSQRGPRTLGVRTNRLRQSIRPRASSVRGGTVTSAIGSNVVYAGVHEFGFSGQVNVRAHTREVTVAFGRPVAPPTSASVRAHTRRMDVPARRPIRRGIDDRLNAYAEAISAAIVSTAV